MAQARRVGRSAAVTQRRGCEVKGAAEIAPVASSSKARQSPATTDRRRMAGPPPAAGRRPVAAARSAAARILPARAPAPTTRFAEGAPLAPSAIRPASYRLAAARTVSLAPVSAPPRADPGYLK